MICRNMSLDTIVEALGKDKKSLREDFVCTQKVFRDKRDLFSQKLAIVYEYCKRLIDYSKPKIEDYFSKSGGKRPSYKKIAKTKEIIQQFF